MSLELSDLGDKTHIWFPLPQRISGGPKEWLSQSDFRIVTDKKFGNQSAYFQIATPAYRIQAKFSVDQSHCEERERRGNLLQADSHVPISSELGMTAKRILLSPNKFIESDEPQIRLISRLLTNVVTTDEEKARRCFDWVVGFLEYANPIRGLYSSIQALTDKKVDCGGFSTLLTALLRASNIPARCVFGWAVESKYGYHAWVEFFDKKKHFWIPCDPSVTHLGNRTKLDAGFGFINDDRVVFSVGEDLNLEGDNIEWNVPLLQSPVVVSLDKKNIPQKFIEKLTWSYSY